MKPAILAGVAACALALSGCSADKVASDINTVNAALTSPKAQQAVANLKAGSAAFVCAISAGAANAAAIEAAINAGRAKPVISSQAVATTQTVYAVSRALCSQLGGVVTGTATVPAN
ncbi:hypothetical protein M2322_003525 [Rhodoblastus acidophilus]|uniref:hypothetical protein n=1 Tax=Rhodoblastus acidophilus TaxID=1074 RepID=UPI002225A273|nr:hypothetical protein [Rhodoblastus acidophilus]MCW2317960.1 hypothetical protein [Rhodoblastus acidophilus]